MTIAKSATPRDAMYELASVGIPDADLLESVIRRHPDHAADLTEFAVELALDALRGDAPVDAGVADVGPSAAVSRAISRFQNKLHEARTAVRSGPSAPPGARAAANPFADLDRTAFRDLAGRLGVSTVFAVKLRDRQIEPETMTDGFRRHVADGLMAPLDVVAAHFAAGAEGGARQFYKADGKPSPPPRQTFAEALASSGLSDGQKAFLLNL
jgi:hypothetical protein